MRSRGQLLKLGGFALLIVLVVVVGVLAGPSLLKHLHGPAPEATREAKALPLARLVGKPEANRLWLPDQVIAALGITTATAQSATEPRMMELSGSLGFDTSTLARARPLFAGVVVEVGRNRAVGADGKTEDRPLDFGDHVSAGQVLAVILSKDLGTMKSQLLTALSQLELDRTTRDNLRRLLKDGSVAPRSVLEAEQKVEADLIAVDAARRTLRSWAVAEDEIKAIEDEAGLVRQGKASPERERKWARYELTAPFDGTILERTVALGETVNDTTQDLFKIGDTRRLRVWANAYEEQLAVLHHLPWPIAWTVRFPGDPDAKPIPGQIEGISDTIDPADHTAKVRGHIANPDGQLRAAQFITATIAVPPGPGEVQVPTAAIVDDGRSSVLFVKSPEANEFTLRTVQVLRRSDQTATVRARPGPSGKADVTYEPLAPGETVVTAGAVELQAALDDLRSAPVKPAGPASQGAAP